jgi:hypothetical protein
MPCVARAQAVQAGPPPKVRFVGQVLDAETRRPVVGAYVNVAGARKDGLTDHDGSFRIGNIRTGRYTVEVSELGYQDLSLSVNIVAGEPLTITLTPDPVLLEGVTVTADRLQSRRRSSPYSVWVFDHAQLANMGGSAAEVVQHLLFPTRTSCTYWSFRMACSAEADPPVYIDERRAYGGMDELASYGAQDLYLIEMYRGSGAQVRAYTTSYMEFLARTHQPLGPLNIW